MRKTIIWTDCGDTIIDEATQLFNEKGDVIEAQPIEDAITVYQQLANAGYRLALVADGRVQSFNHLLKQHGLTEYFECQIISENLGVEKPNQKMFEQAMKEMGLTEADKSKILMIGNNLARDIVGANRFGVQSVWLNWSGSLSYRKEIRQSSEQPTYTISQPADLLLLVAEVEKKLQREW